MYTTNSKATTKNKPQYKFTDNKATKEIRQKSHTKKKSQWIQEKGGRRKIINRTNVEIVDRHGKEVEWTKYNGNQEKTEKIIEFVKQSQNEGNKTIGILCKSMKQAEILNTELKDKIQYHYLNKDTLDYKDGVILASTFLVKGLEFDAVIVVDADKENFKTPIDRQAFYVASTRAMHKLEMLYYNEKPFNF